jgi:hypothetical protein
LSFASAKLGQQQLLNWPSDLLGCINVALRCSMFGSFSEAESNRLTKRMVYGGETEATF